LFYHQIIANANKITVPKIWLGSVFKQPSDE
jgi:hypothetical protein